MGEMRALIPIERALLSTCTALACDEARDHDNLHGARVLSVLRHIGQSPLDVQTAVIDGPLSQVRAAAANFVDSYNAVRGALPKQRLRDRSQAVKGLRIALVRFFADRSDLDLDRAGVMVERPIAAPSMPVSEARHG